MNSQLDTIRLGGVPEHFNAPWLQAIDEQALSAIGIELQWRDCPGGTGEMMQLLNEGQLDLVLALSEGAVAAIANGAPARLLQWYVRSPLLWGIHVAASATESELTDLARSRYAISRPGSGSHLMAAVLAQQQGWPLPTPRELITVGNLPGAITALTQAEADVFLWERFTTQPLVDRGLLRRVGVCPTPWPAFSLVMRQSLPAVTEAACLRLAGWIVAAVQDFRQRENVVELIAERYALAPDQVEEWLGLTEWATDQSMESATLESLIDTLMELQLIKQRPTLKQLCHTAPG
ncbi:MAG: substrate-binding domain-containing protein [Wenzhouxiangellaceae bacterium]